MNPETSTNPEKSRLVTLHKSQKFRTKLLHKIKTLGKRIILESGSASSGII